MVSRTSESESSGGIDAPRSDQQVNSWKWVMAESKESLCRRVYYAARDGMAITLYALLSELPSEDIAFYLDRLNYEDGQKCTPLIAAAMNGQNSVVKMLLNNFKPKIEQEGTVQLDGYVIEGATALWCAAGAGHFCVVKSLIQRGADVNHPTETSSTPLRAACFDGRLDIVQYLINHGADIHIANRYNNTCLMIACYRGHINVVTYLLSVNANVNAKAQCGATALHFAAEHGHLDIVKELLNNNAKITKNKIGMTPLITAAERTKSDIVEYLIGTSLFTKEECVEALELLGASYANDKDHYSLDEAYYYLEWAMKQRKNDPLAYSPKKLLPPMVAYNFHVECQTLEELQAIKDNSNALHMESLVIRERILGVENPEVPHPVVFRGAVFADVGRFDKCIHLWLRALHLRYNSGVTVHKDLLRFAQLFSQMLHIGEDITYECIHQVLDIACKELQRNIETLTPLDEANRASIVDELEDNVHTVLYLLVISSKLLKKFTPEQEHSIYKLVYQISKLNVTAQNGSTLLHLSVNADTPVDDFHTKNVCKFPCAATTRMLIQCGANVNATDNTGNTPLHIIVAYQKPITDFMTLHSIINQLIESGAHVDYVNNNGETPSDAVLTGVAEIILKTQCHINLKCMAAKAVRKFNIVYEDKVPLTLKNFTDMHGVSSKEKKSWV